MALILDLFVQLDSREQTSSIDPLDVCDFVYFSPGEFGSDKLFDSSLMSKSIDESYYFINYVEGHISTA